MGTISCVACRKVIDADPPRCPACGGYQGETDRLRFLRMAQRIGAFFLAACLGLPIGLRVASGPAAAQKLSGPARFRQAAQQQEEKNAATSRAVGDWVAVLRNDRAYPFTTIEDVAVEPAKHAGRAESTVAMVMDYKTAERLIVITTGWGTGARLKADVGALSTDAQKQLLRLCSGPSWSVFKGRWRPDGASVALVVDEFRVIQADAGAKTLTELLSR